MTVQEFDYSEGSTNAYVVGERHGFRSCMVCGKPSHIKLDGTKYHRYFVVGKEFVQDVWPDLSAEIRDHIFTGMHPDCQEAYYGLEEV